MGSPLKKAKAEYIPDNRIAATCPYCEGQHIHGSVSGSGDDGRQKMADCGLGEYILDFSQDKQEVVV
jgi:hypothetical protein